MPSTTTWAELLANTELGIVDVGAGGIVILGVLALMRGWIVPRSTVRDVKDAADRRALAAEVTAEQRIKEAREDAAARLAEAHAQRDDWREAFRASDARGDTLSGQVDKLVLGQQTTVHVLESLSRVAGRRSHEPPE